ncbi:MAG: P-loop NTPase [Deltaproteobacteria bacterium]|nr:P-loop NTPase [Deltaproteobacteria bacterium]
MKEENTQKKDAAPVVWAVGGGKGGVGKSVISTLLAFWLVRMGKRTILVDMDLGGANLHTLLGIKSPERTLNDFVTRRYNSLEDICISTPEKKLRLISGASEILSLSNPHFSQKVKIIKNIFKLDADYVILDLGAGTSFNVLDFFLFAHKRIMVVTPQPISIQNAYGFVRNAVYRRLSQICNQKPSLQKLVKTAMDPKNDLKVRTIKELFEVIQESGDIETAKILKNEIARIKPAVITNMVKDSRDKNAGRIVQLVAEKYLMLHPVDYGSVAYDKQIYSMVSGMVPLTQLNQSSDALAGTYEIATRLL